MKRYNFFYTKFTKQPPYFFYVFVVTFLFISLELFVFPEALDITRYYDNAKYEILSFTNNIKEYVIGKINSDIDFIYFTSLVLALKIGISLNVITTIYLSIYYIAIFEILRRNFLFLRVNNIILFYILMCAPYMWVLSISRNLAGIAFFYLSMLFLNNGKKIFTFIFIGISIFTHFSMILPVLVLLVSFLLQKIKIHNNIVMIFLFASLILSFFIPSFFINLMTSLAGGLNSRYSVYSQIEPLSILSVQTIGYGDIIPTIFIYIYAIYLLLKNKIHDLNYWILFILTVMLSFFILTNLMMTNRIIMMMPMFVGWSALSIIQSSSFKVRRQVLFMSLLGTVSVLAHFWSYRTTFSL